MVCSVNKSNLDALYLQVAQALSIESLAEVSQPFVAALWNNFYWIFVMNHGKWRISLFATNILKPKITPLKGWKWDKHHIIVFKCLCLSFQNLMQLKSELFPDTWQGFTFLQPHHSIEAQDCLPLKRFVDACSHHKQVRSWMSSQKEVLPLR